MILQKIPYTVHYTLYSTVQYSTVLVLYIKKYHSGREQVADMDQMVHNYCPP